MVYLFEDGHHMWVAHKITITPHGRYVLTRLAPQADGSFKTREVTRFENFYSLKERALEVNKKILSYAPEKARDEKKLAEALFTLRG